MYILNTILNTIGNHVFPKSIINKISRLGDEYIDLILEDSTGNDTEPKQSPEEDREVIYEYFTDIKINVFANKIGWEKASSIQCLPVSYKEGCIFVTKNNQMDWQY